MPGKSIGIDFGTYNSSAAVAFGRGHVVTIKGRGGNARYCKNFPSFVWFDDEGRSVQKVGLAARTALACNTNTVIWGVKRLIGLPYKTVLARGELGRFRYKVEEAPDGGVLIKVGQKTFSPSHIAQRIIEEIMLNAEKDPANLNEGTRGMKFEKAVVTVPAYFDATRTLDIVNAVKEAGKEAGVNVNEVETISEPTAAAIRYAVALDNETTMLVFDMGAGTLDVAIMNLVRIEAGTIVPGEVSVSGDQALGGLDMDDLLLAHVKGKYKLIEIEEDPSAKQRLRDEVEDAKIQLSERSESLFVANRQERKLTRTELERVIAPILAKCRNPIRRAFTQSRLTAKDIDHVLFVGGPTYMPCVRRMVHEELATLGASEALLGQIAEYDTRFPVDPQECVGQGAALIAAEVVVPRAKVHAQGFGTSLGWPPYYKQIIRPNLNYPIKKSLTIRCGDPSLLQEIDIVKEEPDADATHSSGQSSKYVVLGPFGLSIIPDGSKPLIELTLEIDKNKELLASLKHVQSSLTVHYIHCGMFLRWPQPSLKSEDEAKPEPKAGGDSSTLPVTRSWLQKDLEASIHAAQEFIRLAEEKGSPSVEVRTLTASVRAAMVQGAESHNPDTAPDILNKSRELVAALFADRVITQEECRVHMEALGRIGANI